MERERREGGKEGKRKYGKRKEGKRKEGRRKGGKEKGGKEERKTDMERAGLTLLCNKKSINSIDTLDKSDINKNRFTNVERLREGSDWYASEGDS